MAVKQIKEQDDANREKAIYLFGDTSLAFEYRKSAKGRIDKSIKLLQKNLSLLRSSGNDKQVLQNLAFIQEEINAAVDDVNKAQDAAIPGRYKNNK